MMKSAISFAKRWLQALARSRRGATAVEYVMVAGLVGAVALPAFAQFDTQTLTAVQDRSSLVAHLGGEATGPVDSLGGEIAGATVNNVVGAAKDGTALLDIAPFLPFGGSKKKSHGEDEEPHATPGIEHAAPEPGAEPGARGGSPVAHEGPKPGERGGSPEPYSEPKPGEPTPHGQAPTAFKEPTPHGEAPIAINEPTSREPPSGPEGRCSNGACKPGNPTGCFVAGTPVLTPGGLKAIEQIQPDDEVVSRDEETGEVSVRRVVQTFVRLNAAVVRVETLDPNDRAVPVEATPGHLFWTAGGWVRADELTQGELLLDAHDGIVRVAGVEAESATATVYNFEVDVTHTYFVGADAVWVHNMAPGSSSAAQASSSSAVPGNRTGAASTQAGRQQTATNSWRTRPPANNNGDYHQVAFPVGNADLNIACLGNDCVIVDLGISQSGGNANSVGHPYQDADGKVDLNALAEDIAHFIGNATNVRIVFTHADADHATRKLVQTLLAPPEGASAAAKALAEGLVAKVRAVYFGGTYAGYDKKLKGIVQAAQASGSGNRFDIRTDLPSTALSNEATPLDPNCTGHCLSLNFLSTAASGKKGNTNDQGLVVAVGVVSAPSAAANDNAKAPDPKAPANGDPKAPAPDPKAPANDNGKAPAPDPKAPANDNGKAPAGLANAPGGNSKEPAANRNGGRLFTAVFTGDAGEHSLAAASALLGKGAVVDVVDTPHHGSENSTHAFTHAPNIRPTVLITSASSANGRQNTSGFPRHSPIEAGITLTSGEVASHSFASRGKTRGFFGDKPHTTTKASFSTGEGPVAIRFKPGSGQLTVTYGEGGQLVTSDVTRPATQGGTTPVAQGGTTPAAQGETTPAHDPMDVDSRGGEAAPGTAPKTDAVDDLMDDQPHGGSSKRPHDPDSDTEMGGTAPPKRKC